MCIFHDYGLSNCLVCGVVAGLVILIGLFFVIKRLRRKKARKNYAQNVVILHHIGRSAWTPSLSPFPIKLETYLRMANITYQNDFEDGFGPKGKTPWITYNNVDLADSQFCIEFLNKKFDVDFNKKLTATDKAVAMALQRLIEDNLYWCIAAWRWVYDDNKSSFLSGECGVPKIFVKITSKNMQASTYSQGTSRHSQEEVAHIAEANLRALSTFLGNKKFLMGFEPTEVDCAAFGMLAMCKWMTPNSPMSKLINGELTNLSEYCERMKAKFWPDWEECITHGGKTKAIK